MVASLSVLGKNKKEKQLKRAKKDEILLSNLKHI